LDQLAAKPQNLRLIFG